MTYKMHYYCLTSEQLCKTHSTEYKNVYVYIDLVLFLYSWTFRTIFLKESLHVWLMTIVPI